MTILALPLLVMLSQVAGPNDALSAARDQVSHGDCEAAVETLTTLLHSGAKQSDDAPLQLLAVCYQRLGHMSRSIETLRDGLRDNPNSTALGRTLGEFLFRQDPNNAEAGQLLESAVKADPQDPEARHYYAQWAYLNNRERTCAEQEQTAARLRGLNDLALLQIYTLQGLCLSHLDQAGAAKLAFEKAYAIDLHQQPFDPAMAYQYTQFLIGRGESEQARKVVEETLSRAPRFGPAHLERAKSFDHERQTGKAIEEAKAALTGEGDDDSNIRAAHVLLARSYFIMGMTKEAEAEQRWVESHASTPQP